MYLFCSADSLSLIATEQELSIITNIQLLDDKCQNQFQVKVNLVSSHLVSDLRFSFEAAAPICFHPESFEFGSLC